MLIGKEVRLCQASASRRRQSAQLLQCTQDATACLALHSGLATVRLVATCSLRAAVLAALGDAICWLGVWCAASCLQLYTACLLSCLQAADTQRVALVPQGVQLGDNLLLVLLLVSLIVHQLLCCSLKAVCDPTEPCCRCLQGK